MMIRTLKNMMIRFAREEDGNQSIELCLMAPLLIFGAFALHAYTDAFRVRSVSLDATGLVADTLSRQTAPIDAGDLAGLQAVAGYITGAGDGLSIRITQVLCESECDDIMKRVLKVSFSKGIGFNPLTDIDLASANVRQKLPLLAKGDRIVLAETSRDYAPRFSFAVGEGKIEAALAVRVRFAPRLCWESCNNGNMS